jgi:predicted site-specific integrase-resolvase
MRTLLTPRDVDGLFRYPAGRAARLAKAGRIPCIRLPDGEIRFDASEIEKMLALPKPDVDEKAVQNGR